MPIFAYICLYSIIVVGALWLAVLRCIRLSALIEFAAMSATLGFTKRSFGIVEYAEFATCGAVLHCIFVSKIGVVLYRLFYAFCNVN